jgi:hypothetical protein
MDPVQVRTYDEGSAQATNLRFEADSTEAAKAGFHPTAQSWAGTALTVTYERRTVAQAPVPPPSPAPNSARVTPPTPAPVPPAPPTPAASPAPPSPPAQTQEPLVEPEPDPLDRKNKLHDKANRALDDNLMPGEEIRVIIRGDMESAMAVTDRRIFIFKKGYFSGVAGGEKLGSWELRNLTGIQFETGVITGVLALQGAGIEAGEVSTSGGIDARKAAHTLYLNRSNFDEAREGVPVLRQLMTDAHHMPASTAAASGSAKSPAEQLRELADLRDSGLVTPEEFEEKRRELVARM